MGARWISEGRGGVRGGVPGGCLGVARVAATGACRLPGRARSKLDVPCARSAYKDVMSCVCKRSGLCRLRIFHPVFSCDLFVEHVFDTGSLRIRLCRPFSM